MSIIYTYPTKATPANDDLILISDSADSNKTKQVKVSSLPGGSGSGVSSVTSANAAITVTDSTTTPVLTSVAYSGGAGIGHVPTGSGSSATVYLDGTGSWSTPSSTDTTINTKNGGVSVANPTTSLDFSTGLTAIGAPGGVASISFSGGLNDLSNASYSGANDASMDIGNGAPSGLIGRPTKTTTLGEGAGAGTTSGSSNTLIGTNAGIGATTGSTNTLVGSDAGDTLTTGSGNVILGAGADSNTNNVNGGIAVGKNTVVSTGSVAIGESASSTGGGIALGRGATNTTANLALGSATYPLLNTADSGDVIGLGTGQAPTKFIEVQIGASKYYMALYEQA